MEKEVYVLTECTTEDSRGATGKVSEVWVFDTFEAALAKMKEVAKEEEYYKYYNKREWIFPNTETACIEYEKEDEYAPDARPTHYSYEITKATKGE